MAEYVIVQNPVGCHEDLTGRRGRVQEEVMGFLQGVFINLFHYKLIAEAKSRFRIGTNIYSYNQVILLIILAKNFGTDTITNKEYFKTNNFSKTMIYICMYIHTYNFMNDTNFLIDSTILKFNYISISHNRIIKNLF